MTPDLRSPLVRSAAGNLVRTAPRSPALRAAGAAVVVAALTVLTGCTGSTAPRADTSASPRAGATGQASPRPSGVGALTSTPLTVPCDELAPAAAVSAAYGGMTLDGTPTAPADSDAAVIEAEGGTVCSWTGQAGATMTLAVGSFDKASLTTLKNSLVTTSNPVPTYHGEGYFQLDGTTGIAEAFSDPYWIVALSGTFSEPGAAEPLVDQAISALAARG
ncbi:hypothetical protein AS850_08975 [Frondihabitans sp. 762G35]|uniref:hypothetical protein n=1 Tax=Frondihabitans sp. 762G35 TaxID=1446794 RepID=UPI000D2252A6|nr:hypothetical protein [Frondihabitans sp. 762G35]ARC57207.1 hypothetical protein AS850_08975 [Frondihabitans sp. 762G35]